MISSHCPQKCVVVLVPVHYIRNSATKQQSPRHPWGRDRGHFCIPVSIGNRDASTVSRSRSRSIFCPHVILFLRGNPAWRLPTLPARTVTSLQIDFRFPRLRHKPPTWFYYYLFPSGVILECGLSNGHDICTPHVLYMYMYKCNSANDNNNDNWFWIIFSRKRSLGSRGMPQAWHSTTGLGLEITEKKI